MTRKLVSFMLVVSMMFCIFTFGVNSKAIATTTIHADGYDVIVTETANHRTSSTVVDGIPMQCKRNLETDEYWLYINENDPIQLQVETLNDNVIAISEIGKGNEIANHEVVGQYVLTLSLAVPAFIEAAKVLICTAACVTLTKTIIISANSIGNVIGGIRSSTNTYNRYRAVDIDAATAIRYGVRNQYNTYYEAYLRNNTVYIGIEISQWGAISRLERGYDVFATSAFAACYACTRAAIPGARGTTIHHTDSREGYYPHYHALGRRWVNNRNYAPHCWYPY